LAHHLRDLAPFVPVYCRLRGFYIARGPRLNFNETKNIGFPADQVDLSPAPRRPEISLHHHITQLPQMKIRVFFALSAGALVSRSRVRRKHAGPNPIQTVNDCSRENCGKHDGDEVSL
jgi:hypothetical protein